MKNYIDALIAEKAKNLRFVKVQFDNSTKMYTYKTLEEVEVGSKVVVNATHSGLCIIEVLEVLELGDVDLNVNFEYKWIVQVIDMTKYDELCEMSNEIYRELNKRIQAANLAKMKEALSDKVGEENVKQLEGLVRL